VILDGLWYGTAPAWQRVVALATLGPPSLAIRLGVSVRNGLFDAGLLPVTRVDGLQIVSVGNLVVGGSGKTPLVIFLARWALAAGRRVAVLTRGYGRQGTTPLDFDATALPDEPRTSDEPRLVARKAPGARIFVDSDRVRAAHAAKAWGAQVVLLDDGFQHRRLARDVDLLIEVPDASPHVLPLGPGREPASSRRRATVRIHGPASSDPTGRLLVERFVGPQGPVPRPARAYVLSGIARPARVLESLRALAVDVVGQSHFADHHRFTSRELEQVSRAACSLGARVVTTEKDRERLPTDFDAVTVETALLMTRGLDTLARVLGWPEACAPVPSVEEGAP
jgi:tetraacyldisaccharide 4'-kinase